MRILEKIRNIGRQISSIDDRLHKVHQSLGRIERRQVEARNAVAFHEHEYQVDSQWGEDGLVQYLVGRVAIARQIFIEFGVENYTEANTRFLLTNNNWSGLVIDGALENIQYIKNDALYWKYNLKADCAFIDRGNINSVIRRNGIWGDIGLLSVDIDGNDYWVWDAIDAVNPRIVICEYNSLWGGEAAVTVPYTPTFLRTEAHFSNLYYGASITALTNLAGSKGYSLVGSNKAGNNAFFVRNDLINDLMVVAPHTAWTQSQFRESRNAVGELTYLSFSDRLAIVADMSLLNLSDGKQQTVREIYDL